jgi:hypothetical protein
LDQALKARRAGPCVKIGSREAVSGNPISVQSINFFTLFDQNVVQIIHIYLTQRSVGSFVGGIICCYRNKLPAVLPYEFLQSDPHRISKILLIKTISRVFAYPFEKRLTENLKLFKLKFMALPEKPLQLIGR